MFILSSELIPIICLPLKLNKSVSNYLVYPLLPFLNRSAMLVLIWHYSCSQGDVENYVLVHIICSIDFCSLEYIYPGHEANGVHAGSQNNFINPTSLLISQQPVLFHMTINISMIPLLPHLYSRRIIEANYPINQYAL